MAEASTTQHVERMLPVQRGKFDVQLVEGGSGPDLVYLHGAGGFTGWAPFLERLSQSCHVVAPAHPGVAGSSGLEHLDNLWDLVLFYEELLHELGLEQAIVIGHSYGGMLAAELAAHRPERVSRLVLVAPLGLWLPDTPVADFFVLTPSERDPLLWYNPASETAQAYGRRPEDPVERMEADLDRTRTLSAVGKFIWPIPDRGLPKRAHRITMPTLLLWGDSDGIVPPAYGPAFRELLPNAILQVIERCGHIPQMERPGAFHEAVEAFLNG